MKHPGTTLYNYYLHWQILIRNIKDAGAKGGVTKVRDNKKEVYCNACGKPIEVIPKINICKEYLSIEKEWGYFSKKDFIIHSFAICEHCYDQWINTFVIPVGKQIQTEWAVTLPEETPEDKEKEPR